MTAALSNQQQPEPFEVLRPEKGWGFDRAGRRYVEIAWKQFTDAEIDELRLIHGAEPK